MAYRGASSTSTSASSVADSPAPRERAKQSSDAEQRAAGVGAEDPDDRPSLARAGHQAIGFRSLCDRRYRRAPFGAEPTAIATETPCADHWSLVVQTKPVRFSISSRSTSAASR